MEDLTYEEFIQNILDTRGRFACGDEYHERRHIIPKSCGGTDDKENLIDLYAREHFEAHRLLALENPDNEKLVYAWWCMSIMKNEYTKERYKISKEEYEEMKKQYAIMRSETMSGKNAPNYGKKHSDETKKIISEKAKERYKNPENHPMYGVHRFGKDSPHYGKKHTAESKEKMSKGHKGLYKDENSPSAKPVICLDTMNVYGAISLASKHTGTNSTCIGACCYGRRKSAGGLQWKFVYDVTSKNGTFIPGAITLGIITESEANTLLSSNITVNNG